MGSNQTMHPTPPVPASDLAVDDHRNSQDLLSRWVVRLSQVLVNSAPGRGTTCTLCLPQKSFAGRAAGRPKTGGRFDDWREPVVPPQGQG